MFPLWIDDVRLPPQGWVWAKNYEEALFWIKTGKVSFISFDHDLGEESQKTGYDIAVEVERMAEAGLIIPLGWAVHSANPVGKQRIIHAMTSADRFFKSVK
jgi:hypothetical protein